MTEIDWATIIEQAKTATFAVVPDGDYHIKVEEPQSTTASTGKPMLKFRCRIQSGPHARGSLLTQQTLTMDNEQALAIFMRFLKAFGIDETILLGLGKTPNLEPVARLLDGREAIAVVGHDMWQGENRNKVSRFKPLAGAAPSVQAVATSSGPGIPNLPGYGTAPAAPAAAPVAPAASAVQHPVQDAPAAPAAPVAPAAVQHPVQDVPAAPQVPAPAPAAPVATVPTVPATDGAAQAPAGVDPAMWAQFLAMQQAQAPAPAAPEAAPAAQPVPPTPTVDEPKLPY